MPQAIYTAPEKILDSFKSLGGRQAVTSGHFEILGKCSIEDLDWNHMDQMHRPCLHRTYAESMRLVRTADLAVSLTKVKAAGIPCLMLVTDVRLRPGLFYQFYTILGLIYVHTVIQMIPSGEKTLQTVDWHIVSHPLLKFLHGNLSRRLKKLNEIQNAEDVPVRDRRYELRRKGYSFASDNPDFLNSNTLTNNVKAPAIHGTHRVSLKALTSESRGRVAVGPIELLVRPNGESFTFWTAVCPHEGGPLEAGAQTGNQIECIWHGLKFPGLTLSPGKPKGNLCGLDMSLEGSDLIVRSSS